MSNDELSPEDERFWQALKPYARRVVLGGGDGLHVAHHSEEDMEWSRKFHAHLDACKQCAEKPFDLCDEGARILMRHNEKEEAENAPTK